MGTKLGANRKRIIFLVKILENWYIFIINQLKNVNGLGVNECHSLLKLIKPLATQLMTKPSEGTTLLQLKYMYKIKAASHHTEWLFD